MSVCVCVYKYVHLYVGRKVCMYVTDSLSLSLSLFLSHTHTLLYV